MDTLLRLAVLIAVAYAAVCGLLYLLQDRLIFLPQPLMDRPAGPHVRPASLERDDVTLRGWVVNPDASGPLVIYFGGNAEELSGLVETFARLPATTVLMNYRGYGESEGSPAAAKLIADARAVAHGMAERWGDGRPLILFGRSIGSGIAAQAARAAQVDGLILMSPYRTLTQLARHHMPWMPVGRLLRQRIDTTAALDTLPPRILVLYGRRDHIIPTAESRALVRLLDPPPVVVEFDAGHNVALTHAGIWPHVKAFLSAHASGAS